MFFSKINQSLKLVTNLIFAIVSLVLALVILLDKIDNNEFLEKTISTYLNRSDLIQITVTKKTK